MAPARPLPCERSAPYAQLGAGQAAGSLEEEATGELLARPLTTGGQGLVRRLNPGRLPPVARAVLVAGLLVATACAAWLGGGARRLRRMEEGHMEVLREVKGGPTWVQEFTSMCGKMDIDVEYQDTTSGWGANFDHIKTPEMCCALCQGHPKCVSFTWVKDAGLDGCPSQCWLKGGLGVPVKKVGFVSGTPPAKPVLPEVPDGKGGPGGTLWCFSLMQPKGYERSMLQWQHAHKASIFACDGFGVYSNKEIKVAPGVTTHVVDSNLKCNFGGDSGTALNAWIFIAVWDKVIDDGDYKKFDWTVKVDPDCVFFPDRLGRLLASRPKVGYINNCKYGMHGPIEVFSSDSITILGADYAKSWDGKAPKTCVTNMTFGEWGEDMFLDQCLQRILKVTPRPLVPQVMCEDHCDCPAWYWCQNGTDRVSYHPFKTPESYEVCMANALGGKPGPPTPLPEELLHPIVDEGKEAPLEPAKTPAAAAGGGSAAAAGGSSNATGPSTTRASTEAAAAGLAAAAKNLTAGRAAGAGNATAAGEEEEGPCADAVELDRAKHWRPAEGQEDCAKEVMWAKEHGVYEHPDWYSPDGLSADSSYLDFQLGLFNGKKGNANCPRPCSKSSASSRTPSTSNASTGDDKAAVSSDIDPQTGKKYPQGPIAHTFYMYRAQSKASYPLENINTADLAGVMWYLHNEVVRNTPRKYHIDRIKRFKVTVQNTWEFWNAHKRQFGAFVAYDAGRCSTPICKDIYRQYGFIVGCQVCDTSVASYLAKSQTNWNCEKGSEQCRAPLWYSLPGPCPEMGMSNDEIAANKVGLDVMRSKTPDCIKRMPGGHCDKANGAPNCTYSYEEAGEISLDELAGIGDYDDFWNASFTRCAAKVATGQLPGDTQCVHQKEYVGPLDKGIGCSFWDGIHDEQKCTDRMNAVRKLFKKHFPEFPESLPEPACEFDMYYEGEFKWKINHTGALESDWWAQRMMD